MKEKVVFFVPQLVSPGYNIENYQSQQIEISKNMIKHGDVEISIINLQTENEKKKHN